MKLGTEEYLMIVFIGLGVGWLTSVMTGKGFIKHLIWGLAGAVLGAFMLPQAGVTFNFGSPTADLAAFTGLGAVFCALVSQVLT